MRRPAARSRLKAAGCDAEPLTVDIGDDAALRNAIEGTAARHGRLDIVFANAGGSAGPGFSLTPDGSIDVADLATFDRWMAINFRANYLTIRFAATPMKQQKRGSIIATSSIAGIKSDPLVSYGYVAAKAAISTAAVVGVSTLRRRASSTRPADTSAMMPMLARY